MNELTKQVHRLLRVTFFLLAVYVFLWGMAIERPFFAGLILGTAISMVNALYSAGKIQRIRRAVEQNRPAKGSSGMLFRFGNAALGAFVALRFPEHFHIVAYAVGIVTVQGLAWLDGLVTLKK